MSTSESFLCRSGIISLVYSIFIMGLSGCSGSNINLVQNIDQSVANDIVLNLGQNGISAVKQIQKDGSYAILVSKKDQIAALSLIKNNGQPNQVFQSLGQVFKKEGFISSPLEEQSRLVYALDQEISAMLSELNGVISVKTEVSLPAPTDNLWQSVDAKPAASVLIKYKSGYRIDLYVNRIKQLVSNSVPGLTKDRVEVLAISSDIKVNE